jgi:outer membrane protein assembly factor BamB
MNLSKAIQQLTLAGTMLASSLNAQETTFKQEWKVKVDTKSFFLTTCSIDASEVVATTKKAVYFLNGKDGSKVWGGDLETLFGLKDSDLQKYVEDAGVLFVFNRKKGADQLVCIDTHTGKMLWNTEKYEGIGKDNVLYFPEIKAFLILLKEGADMVDARTGVLKYSLTGMRGGVGLYKYLADKKEILIVNAVPTTLSSMFKGFKNQLLKIEAETGRVIWETEYRGQATTELVSDKMLLDWQITSDKILLQLDGLQVFDLATGKALWHAELNMDINHHGLLKASETYHAIADPLIVKDDVYMVEVSENGKKKALKKYDLNTGKLLWSNEEINGKKTVIPELSYVNGVIIAQLGGYVNNQTIKQGNNQTIKESVWEQQGPFGLKAFDAATGKMIWSNETPKDLITGVVTDDNSVYVATETSFLKIDAKSGTVKYEMKNKAANVGDPEQLLDMGDKVATYCANGVVAYKKEGGTTAYATPVKNLRAYEPIQQNGKAYFVKTKKELVRFDFNSGVVDGSYTFDGDIKWRLSKDGESIILFVKGGEVSKYSTKK